MAKSLSKQYDVTNDNSLLYTQTFMHVNTVYFNAHIKPKLMLIYCRLRTICIVFAFSKNARNMY